MTKELVRAGIEEIGIIPAIRVSSSEDALFAAEAVSKGGIKIVEITMTVPAAMDVVSHLVRNNPELIVGSGTVLDKDTARRCLDAGAHFLTSTGLDLEVVDLAVKEGIVVLPGALTPTEVIMAWKAGADFVKIFPCSEMGGPRYIRALKGPFPQVPLIAAGGVGQQTIGDFILAGAVAVGIGRELIPQEAIQHKNAPWIVELTRRFVGLVKAARSQSAGR